MIWKAFSRAELTAIIEQQSRGLIGRLQELLPLVDDGLADVGTASTLARIAESFLPSDIFADATFRRALLDRLEPKRLQKVFEAVLGPAAKPTSFAEMVDALVESEYRELVRTFVEMGELADRFLPTSAEPIVGITQIVPPSNSHPLQVTRPFRQLMDYQHFIYSQCANHLQTDRARVVLQMPTGSGKTRTAMELIAARLNAGSERVVVWLAHNEELCDQAVDSFRDVFAHLARVRCAIVRNWGSLYSGAFPDGNVLVVTTYQTLCRGGGALHSVDPRRIALVVADEAHMAVAPKYKQAILESLGPTTCVLGLTATPIRVDPSENEELREFFFNRIVSSSDNADFSTRRLQERKILATPRFLVAPSNLRVVVGKREATEFKERQDVSAGVLKTLSLEASRNALVVKSCKHLAKDGRSVLVFACSVEHSRFLASVLVACGVRAAYIDGDCDSNYRRGVVEAFRQGVLQVLCNFGVLTTGFDAPNTDAVVLARPTLSPVLYSQMVGRAMRGPEMGGKAETTIIDIRDNFEMFGRPLDLFERFRDLWSDAST